MILDNTETIRYLNGTLYITGGGRIWTRDMAYDVSGGKTTVITFDAQLHYFGGREPFNASSELMLTFFTSYGTGGWAGQEDFHLRIGCDMREHGFYTLLRTADNKLIGETAYLLLPGRWHRLRIELTEDTFTLHSNGSQILGVSISEHLHVPKGRIGFLGYRPHPWEIRNLDIEIQE